MRIHWRAFAILAVGSLLGGAFLPAPAAAQEAPGAEDEAATERARELFSEGIDFVERQEWAPAAERFRAALELKDAPAVRYNLALSLHELGQVAEAERLVESVLADPETPALVREQAEALAAEIRERGGAGTEAEAADEPVAPSPAEVAAATETPAEEPSPEGSGDSLVSDWRFWAVVGGAVVLVGLVAVIAATSGGVEDPVEGNFEPGVLRW